MASQTTLRRDRSLAPLFGPTSFTVLVGSSLEDCESFSVHQDLAMSESDFFYKAFNNKWRESQEKEIPLPDHKSEHFRIFFLWLYTREVFSAHDQTGSEEWDLLAGSWALGAYLQATDFQDAITDAIVELANNVVSRHSIHETIYSHSVAGAPIRKLIVDIAVSHWDTNVLEAYGEDTTCPDFFRHLPIGLVKTKSSSPKRAIAQSCDYHEHQRKGSPCYKTKSRGFP